MHYLDALQSDCFGLILRLWTRTKGTGESCFDPLRDVSFLNFISTPERITEEGFVGEEASKKLYRRILSVRYNTLELLQLLNHHADGVYHLQICNDRSRDNLRQ